MSRNFKRRMILGIMLYIMINCFAWGIMKAYINSHNCVSHDKLAMAQITDSEDGKRVSIIGGSITIPNENIQSGKTEECLKTLVPVKIRMAGKLFFEAVNLISE